MASAAIAPLGRTVLAQDGGIDCEPDPPFRGPEEVTPANGARGVTINAYVKILYGEGALGPELDAASLIELRRCETDDVRACETGGELVSGRAQIVGDRWLFFVPSAELASGTTFAGIARGVEGDLPFSFTTGSARDLEPPRLGDIPTPTTARVDLPACEGGAGFRVDLRFPPAQDDGPAGSLEYQLFLTRGATLRAPELRQRVRNTATDEITMAIVLRDAEAVAPVCVVVHAVDGLGRVDADGAPVCFEPVQGTYFEACSVGAPGASRAGFGAVGLVVVSAFLVARRRARTSRGRWALRVGT